ncbi:hypothetical protein [Shewanella sp. NIFS-20-20]|uniref:hypothetical protein n=1 Tax=Shewanella sp. NIFS-20-20 TaxID=2853806 RepID=UPI001C48E7F3|nr:hypothetical protein [Shewanella sp. NIFS-20-20]MBV7315304.1 hypothetical protein [Shewanella sp. NIFS-20-20]
MAYRLPLSLGIFCVSRGALLATAITGLIMLSPHTEARDHRHYPHYDPWSRHVNQWRDPFWYRPYWRNHYYPFWRNPYRYAWSPLSINLSFDNPPRRTRQNRQVLTIAAPTVTTLPLKQVSHNDGVNQLGQDAQVVLIDGRYRYRWQGTLWCLDWHSERYFPDSSPQCRCHRCEADMVK